MSLPSGQKARMLAGERYLARDPELVAERRRAQVLLARFNAAAPEDDVARAEALAALLGALGEGTVVQPPFRCDYGAQIAIGARSFLNSGCALLDCARIIIGQEVQIGPGVHLYTANHPIDAATHRAGWESALPIAIGDGVWLGGGVIVCPGVSIGENTVVGAGSVVTRSLPANVVAAGNPCRVLRPC